MKWEDIYKRSKIYLYCGDLPKQRIEYTKKNFVGLSLIYSDKYHIKHDINNRFNVNDNSVDIVQSEDVMEHIEYDKLTPIINDIHRILKVGGLFRLSVPDYMCDLLQARSLKDASGDIYFDPGGGGGWDANRVVDNGHLWFPTYHSVKQLLEKTHFRVSYKFLHYYEGQEAHIYPIDYSLGYIHRTPDNDKRVQDPRRPLSLVVDCIKEVPSQLPTLTT